jgi:hypothetical protein
VFFAVLWFSFERSAAENPRQSSRTTETMRVLGMDVPVLTDFKEVEQHVGRLVALRGVVTPGTKIPGLIGVEVKSPDALRGREAYAVGILATWTAEREEAEAGRRANSPIPGTGPGVKYLLYFDLSGKLAEARPLP